jgi:hypothetical protein
MKNITNTDTNTNKPIVISSHSTKRYERRLQLIYTYYCEQHRNDTKQARKHNYCLHVETDVEALQLLKWWRSGIFICSWLTSQRSTSSEIMGAPYFLRHARTSGERANEASSVLLSYTDNELNGDKMLEIRRGSNEKKVGMKPGKCAQRGDAERN